MRTQPITDYRAEALVALDRALDSTERMQGDPQPNAAELLGWLSDHGFAVVKLDEPNPRQVLDVFHPQSDPEAADAAQRMFEQMILHSDGTRSDLTAITAATVSRQVTLDFGVRWERGVNIDDEVGPTRGRPGDPNRYVRRLVLFGGWQHDPDGEEASKATIRQIAVKREWLRRHEAAGRAHEATRNAPEES